MLRQVDTGISPKHSTYKAQNLPSGTAQDRFCVVRRGAAILSGGLVRIAIGYIARADDTQRKEQGKESGGVTRRERVVVADMNPIDQRQNHIRIVVCKISNRTGRIDNALDDLRNQTGKQCACRSENCPTCLIEQKSHADNIRKPFAHLGVILIEYITRCGVAVAQEQVQLRFWNVAKRNTQRNNEQ